MMLLSSSGKQGDDKELTRLDGLLSGDLSTSRVEVDGTTPIGMVGTLMRG